MTVPPHVVLPSQAAQHTADLVRETEHRRKAEAALRAQEEKYRTVVEMLSDGIAIVDADGTISMLNESAARMVGAPRERLLGQQLLGLRWHAVYEDGSFMEHEDHPVLITLRTGDPVTNAVLGLFQRDGSIRWLSVNTYPLRHAPEEAPYAVASSFTDITAQLQREQAMQESYRALDQLTSEFIGIVSHELRTPLTSIRGALGLLESDVFASLPPKAHALVGVARSNTERLMRIINNIIDLEQIEGGKVTFTPSAVEVSMLLHNVAQSLRPHADVRQITIISSATVSGPVWADTERLFQILEILLNNAIKFSPANEKITVKAVELPERIVRFEVTDHGLGITPDKQARLFQRFMQADASDTRRPGGAGLGLAIARALVERMNGAIGVVSEPNVFTTFWVQVPKGGAPAA